MLFMDLFTLNPWMDDCKPVIKFSLSFLQTNIPPEYLLIFPLKNSYFTAKYTKHTNLIISLFVHDILLLNTKFNFANIASSF